MNTIRECMIRNVKLLIPNLNNTYYTFNSSKESNISFSCHELAQHTLSMANNFITSQR